MILVLALGVALPASNANAQVTPTCVMTVSGNWRALAAGRFALSYSGRVECPISLQEGDGLAMLLDDRNTFKVQAQPFDCQAPVCTQIISRGEYTAKTGQGFIVAFWLDADLPSGFVWGPVVGPAGWNCTGQGSTYLSCDARTSPFYMGGTSSSQRVWYLTMASAN